MIGESFLGESLNFLIGKLKLSYKRIFPIIGESLAEVSSGLWRGGLVGIFIAGYAMKPPSFLNNFIFVLMHFRVFLKDQPYGVVIFSGLRGRVDASRQPCPVKRLTPMGLFGDVRLGKWANEVRAW
ncbi:hypothetical protein [Alloprevotella tannerae]|uniref:hypothetical protein n=1 Tax=Alloprevotella tannerae TaxID=76122 RepID=UPI0026F1C3E6|nr:hypothetical protein [Alloprevotella tannerae]